MISKKAILATALLLMAFTLPEKRKTVVYLIGDSTLSKKETKNYPETGWGMPFADYFDSSVVVDDRAVNGRSTRTFIEEGRWDLVMQALKPGDYVFIQFGHNDEVPTKRSYTSPEQYIANLKKFVEDTRSKGARPVLITPVARRRFDSSGNIVETHPVYAPLVLKAAKEEHAALIDLDARSQAMLQQLGPENSRFLFNYLSPGENPHYPDGWHDDTHFNELGARKVAELVIQGIKNQGLPLAKHILMIHRKPK